MIAFLVDVFVGSLLILGTTVVLGVAAVVGIAFHRGIRKQLETRS